MVLRQKTQRLFLLNLLTQYGNLGSILAIATRNTDGARRPTWSRILEKTYGR
jgi:hypothetical protein